MWIPSHDGTDYVNLDRVERVGLERNSHTDKDTEERASVVFAETGPEAEDIDLFRGTEEQAVAFFTRLGEILANSERGLVVIRI